MEQSFDQALQSLALEVDGLAGRVEDIRMRLGEVRALYRREKKAERDPDYVERVADFDLMKAAR